MMSTMLHSESQTTEYIEFVLHFNFPKPEKEKNALNWSPHHRNIRWILFLFFTFSKDKVFKYNIFKF